MTDLQLVTLATTMLERAYCPYSHFPVGAALEAEDGRIFTGCNVENAAYGETICAERVAVTRAVSEGARRFRRIAIVSRGEALCCPCGSCRQVLSEFASELTVLCGRADGTFQRLTLSELLPHGFGAGNLDR